MPIPTPCSLGELLDAARLVLVAEGVFTDAQTFLTLDPDDVMLNPPASPLCGVTWIGFDQRDESIHSESDNDDVPTMEGDLVCSLWIRIALDIEGHDKYLMLANETTNKVRGASEIVRQIVAALTNQSLYNADGDMITWRTLNFDSIRNRGKWRQDRNWRRIDVRFNATFNLKLADTPPPSDVADYFPEPLFDLAYDPKPYFV